MGRADLIQNAPKPQIPETTSVNLSALTAGDKNDIILAETLLIVCLVGVDRGTSGYDNGIPRGREISWFDAGCWVELVRQESCLIQTIDILLDEEAQNFHRTNEVERGRRRNQTNRHPENLRRGHIRQGRS